MNPNVTSSQDRPSLEIDRALRRARWGEDWLALGGRAFDLLAVLADRAGDHVPADTLMAAVWPGRVVEAHNLRMQVNRLRQILGADAVSTQPGRGYRLEVPVRRSRPSGGARLIGRDSERAELAEQVRLHRLCTVAGAGGIGKTTLVRDWYEELPLGPTLGCAWVDLTGAAEAQIAALAAAALGLQGNRFSWTVASLIRALPTRPTVLVLDNAEHLAPALAKVVRDLLAGSPHVRVVVTSQVPLRLPVEKVLRLGPLDLPEPDASVEQALRHAALQLLVERVRALDSRFALDEARCADAIAVCRQLDGLPLAIELAAARVPVLGLATLVRSLDERLALLHSPANSRPLRQQTLRAALEWTHGLLGNAARTVFARLGVFTGPFTFDAALAVAGDRPTDGPVDRLALIDALSELVDASMVVAVREGQDGTPGVRYQLLETPRLFALQCLHDGQQHDALRQRHLAWCLQWVQDADAVQLQAGQAQLKTALDWALSGGDVPGGTELARRLMAHPGLAALDDASQRSVAPANADDTLARLLQRLRLDGVAEHAARAGLADDALLELARRLSPAELNDLDGAVRELDQAVDLARCAVDRPVAEDPDDRYVAQVLDHVAAHTRAGRFDEGSDLIDEAVAELERRELRRRAAHRDTMRLLLDSGVQHDLLRRDAFAVARRTAALLSIDAPDGPTRVSAWREREAQALSLGQASTGTLWLEVAVELTGWRLTEARDADERVSARLALARALLALGEREAGADLVRRAATVCRDGLREVSSEVDPQTWAALQHELASALVQAAVSASDTAELLEAVQCCQAALTVRTRAAMPLEWAATQHVHGTALKGLGTREVGSQRLQDAVRVLKEALLERTPARAPVDRVRTMQQLGHALTLWAVREDGAQRHFEALSVQQSALAALAPSTAPVLWATLCNNIGISHNYLGLRGIEPETHWRSAAEAYRRGLGVATRDNAPGLWSRLQHNLGMALALLGDLLSAPDVLKESADSFGRSLLENTREREPVAWSASKSELADALLSRGRLLRGEPGLVLLEQAIGHVKEALLVRRPDTMPNEWLTSMSTMAFAEYELGIHRQEPAHVRAAADLVASLLDQPQAATLPVQRAQMTQLLANARHWLASRDRSGSR